MGNITDNWSLPCTKVLMRQDDFRDLVAWGLMEQGWSEEDALREADRRLAVVEAEAEEPEPLR